MISKNDVEYVAHLSRIHLGKEEIELLTKNLEDILHYINKLKELDVENIEPTSHALALKNVHRDDILKPSLKREDVLVLAVQKEKGFFKVPKIIE